MQWKSDSNVDDRISSQHLATHAHKSNLRQSKGKELPPMQSDIEAGQDKNVFRATVTIQIAGTSPFSVDLEHTKSAIIEMLTEKDVISKLMRTASVESRRRNF